MAYACKICIFKNGLRGSEIARLPQTESEFLRHLETVHGLSIKRVIEPFTIDPAEVEDTGKTLVTQKPTQKPASKPTASPASPAKPKRWWTG